MDPDSFLSLFTGDVTMHPLTLGAIIALIVAVFLLFISGYMSASEIAFFSMKPNDIRVIREGKTNADLQITDLLKDSSRLLATILIVNNFVNIGAVTLCGFFFTTVFDFTQSPFLGFLCLTVVLTAVILLFGEVMPKVYAGQRSLAFSRFAAPGLVFFRKLCYPLATLLIRSTHLVNKKVMAHSHSSAISMDELSQALELTSDEEMEGEMEILEGVIKFRDKKACEVMTPRLDICDLDIHSSFTEVLDMVRESGYSRIPVYSDSHDDIRGLLYIKDLLIHLDKPASFRWQTLIRPALFVPETKRIDLLLEEFKKSHIHMAIVVDEYGGVSGLVSFEDVVEEIVGEISDEYDEEEPNFKQIDPQTFDCEGKILLIDFFKITEVDEDDFEEVAGEVDTLGGLVLELKGDFPVKNEVITYKKYEFTILEVSDRRILKVRFHVRKNEIEEETADD